MRVNEVERICPICKQRMKSRIAFTSVVSKGGFIVGRAEENLPGHLPISNKVYPTLEEAQAIADQLNAEFGVSKEEAYDIVCSSMSVNRRLKNE